MICSQISIPPLGASALPISPSLDLERLLAPAFETARARWPDVTVTAAQFMRHVAERLPAAGTGPPVEQVLEELHLSDLYLACACTLGVPRAADAFERDYLTKIPSILRHHRHSTELI